MTELLEFFGICFIILSISVILKSFWDFHKFMQDRKEGKDLFKSKKKHGNCREVINLTTGKKYDSVKKAAIALNTNSNTIRNIIIGKTKKSRSIPFAQLMYFEDYVIQISNEIVENIPRGKN